MFKLSKSHIDNIILIRK